MIYLEDQQEQEPVMKDSQPQVNTTIRLYFIHHDTFQWSELSMTVEVQCVFFFFLFSFLFFLLPRYRGKS